MLPIRDINPRHKFPWVNMSIIAINILAFGWELLQGPALDQALRELAFIPARFWMPGQYLEDGTRILVSMFLHAGFLHIGSNMLYLWIFGDNVEDRMGHFRYAIFYLACGYLATLAHAFSAPDSSIPTLGASGAIAGVLGAYLILFPRVRVVTFIPLGYMMLMRELPALIVLGLWFVLQLFTGVASLGIEAGAEQGGVAWFAHIGGFVAGMILVFLLGVRRTKAAPIRG